MYLSVVIAYPDPNERQRLAGASGFSTGIGPDLRICVTNSITLKHQLCDIQQCLLLCGINNAIVINSLVDIEILALDDIEVLRQYHIQTL